jgi:hypothetical protein
VENLETAIESVPVIQAPPTPKPVPSTAVKTFDLDGDPSSYVSGSSTCVSEF